MIFIIKIKIYNLDIYISNNLIPIDLTLIK